MNLLEKIFKEQIVELGHDMEKITNPFEKAQVRVKLIDALAKVINPIFSDTVEETSINDIRVDLPKEPISVTEEHTFEEIEEEVTTDVMGTYNEVELIPSFEEVEESIEEFEEIQEEHEQIIDDEVEEVVTEEVTDEIEEITEIVDEQIIEETEEVERIYVLNSENEEVDITDEYTYLYNYTEGYDSNSLLDLALQIKNYECLDKYALLGTLVIDNESGTEEYLEESYYKVFLAHYMTALGDDINEYVKAFTEGYMKKLVGFINNDNIEAFVNYINSFQD